MESFGDFHKIISKQLQRRNPKTIFTSNTKCIFTVFFFLIKKKFTGEKRNQNSTNNVFRL